ncbi:hypothetical protein ESB00_11955 [Oleiharenicola lentus]|uniref:Uncharacterized protein n=1 Tax=Oleiharenicola lentus TaxID=2508720 RepID=A0A4Q1CBQ5_9BACT|nr:hypothetical protein [Oleiharenicola lentus]RXK56543.1 hypothetical protein ESB00_11955 [Oleiharenicola lentus]
MPFTPASTGSLLAFCSILIGVLYAVLFAIHLAWRSLKITALAGIVIGIWLGILSALVASGRLATLPLNGLPFFFGPILVFCIGFAVSPVGGRLAATISLAALVGFQAFRLPLELVLHAWFKQGVIPETMTWSGYNWDIASGLVALACFPLANRHRWAARLANVVGFALLLNVMRVAILSAPVAFGWNVQPPLLLAFHLPYALIAPVCVGGALFGHIVLTRALWGRQAK